MSSKYRNLRFICENSYNEGDGVVIKDMVASTSNATVFLLRSELNLVNNLCVIWA